jgi:flagella basal body P-ring formation protein FlgA
LLAEVGQWVQQSYRLGAEQFSFAPMDARVQMQSCDRPLVIDAPFATRETVRVRCLGNPSWQLYLRVALKPGVTLGVTPATPAPPASAPLVLAPATPKAAAASAPPTLRKVVVGRQFLRYGTALSPEMLEEQEIPAPGVDLLAVSSIKDLEYGEMVRDMQAGVPLRSHDVRRATLVKQGQAVLLTIGQSGGFAISARVEAMQDGKMGEQIRLKNPESGRIITGVVTGTGTARGF